ncbi:MAG: Lrp/AsnC family transcriptional regulator [Methanomassiliicoccales archaeon]|nr:Lrp/AsnC family transcriptional regulator [Methanomassiliicoccales archaeon]NYT14777.1 Lrp/AsnC family transcriptional regulator [Methanomassiliicoccales archaeon]
MSKGEVKGSMDEMNRKILRLLRTDGKMSYREVAQKLKRSPSTVRDRIGRMENDGVILGYVALINAEQMGIHTEAILLANMEGHVRFRDLIELKKVNGILEVLFITGDKNVMIRIQAPDNRTLDETITKKIVPIGLRDIDLKVVLESVMRFPDVGFAD